MGWDGMGMLEHTDTYGRRQVNVINNKVSFAFVSYPPFFFSWLLLHATEWLCGLGSHRPVYLLLLSVVLALLRVVAGSLLCLLLLRELRVLFVTALLALAFYLYIPFFFFFSFL
ncbi:hypothetical protein B0T21DRAFT_364204 [Apiosordaria backusii]|uniref:Uncharacterized protein n=1 Tax=Apiosordaria backusii TaxID=314023 RepID=A0AA40BMM3_9PEZI|nr:hypothetical protein B0T21DRAFT_364204 [Apiosordaria backusii]